MLTNQEIGKLLRRMAAVFQVKDNDFFRTRAYQNAAVALENLTISARDLWEQGKLTEIPGIGPNLAGHLDELFKTGKVRHFDQEMKRVPAGMFALLGVRGVGPKLAYKIATTYKLKNEKTALKQVKQLIEAGKLAQLEGFGEKLQAKIKTSIESRFKKKERLLLSEALTVANGYLEYLAKQKSVISAEPLGSLRRRVATVGDIDLAICTQNTKEAMAAALKYPQINKVIASGEAVSRVQLKTGHEIDLKLGSPSEWGSLLQHYTGSKLHNIALRSYALENHLSLSEHGIKNLRTKKIYQAKSEAAFYRHLGLPYLPPELREGEEELAWAKDGHIPKLIELEEIKGDLHLHSNFDYQTSHDLGVSPLASFLKKASDLHYEYIGISDHNPKLKGLTKAEKKKILDKRKAFLVKEYKAYEKSVKKNIPKLLIGLEVDIRSDGELALEEDLLAELDYIIVSIHSTFDLDKEANTQRIIKALSHPKAMILGHPTGRLLNERESIQADWLRVVDFCKANHKYLELNASPLRLDLPDDLVKIAVRSGVKVAIDSDSHAVDQMENIPFGVWTARRGWCQKKDCLNALAWTDLKQLLK